MTTVGGQLLSSTDDNQDCIGEGDAAPVPPLVDVPPVVSNAAPKSPPPTAAAAAGDQTTNGPAAGAVESAESKKAGTRVFKKSCPNGKITTYLGKRDFVDHGTHIDPIDGVVLVDTEYVKDRKVFVHVLAAFRYGREDLDVLGLTFRKDLYLASVQVFPPIPEEQKALTRLQERLIKKLGSDAYPFRFELPENCPASVTLQPAIDDKDGKPCGVDYELRTYVGDCIDEKPHKRNSVNLAIRKVTYADPKDVLPQPRQIANKEFLLRSNLPLHLEVTLDSGKYYHGQTLAVNVHIRNNSKKEVKKIKIIVKQYADICLFNRANYKCSVAYCETDRNTHGLPVMPSQCYSGVFHVTPLLENNKRKRGLALDGKLKHEDTNLATSTMFKPSEHGKEDAENMHGIVVSYKVKCVVEVAFSRPLVVFLPFILTHPKPELTADSLPSVAEEQQQQQTKPVIQPKQEQPVEDEEALDTNLINFDTNGVDQPNSQDEDLIFEEFARLRLKGAEGEGTEA